MLPLCFKKPACLNRGDQKNHGDTYLGPIPLRQALYQSRNMVAIRLLQSIGVKSLINSLPRFGFPIHNMDPNLSLALGSHAFSPFTMAAAYAVISNGGFKVEPFFGAENHRPESASYLSAKNTKWLAQTVRKSRCLLLAI
jgi:penicillin-binding protein 1A